MQTKTLYWQDNTLFILDQTLLPLALNYIEASDVDTVVDAIKRLCVRGAPAIGVAAAYAVVLSAIKADPQANKSLKSSVIRDIEKLWQSRPTAVNLHWALSQQKDIVESFNGSPAQLVDSLLARALSIHEQDIQINQSIGDLGASLLKPESVVITHCNAGALATAGYGTALGVIRSAFKKNKISRVYAGETRPLLQGARLTAWELEQSQIPVTLITDSMAGYLMQTKKVSAVIVGADRIAANGDTANKIGTYTLAVLARAHNVPFYVAAPTSTFDLQAQSAKDIPIEERHDDEVRQFQGVVSTPEGMTVWNPAFDITPANLISAIICEKGIINCPNMANIKAGIEGK